MSLLVSFRRVHRSNAISQDGTSLVDLNLTDPQISQGRCKAQAMKNTYQDVAGQDNEYEPTPHLQSHKANSGIEKDKEHGYL